MNEPTIEMTEPARIPGRFASRLNDIRPLKVCDVTSFSRAIQPLLSAVNAAMEANFAPAAVLDLVTEHTDALIKAVSIASGITEEDLRNGDLADLVDVIAAVTVANQRLTQSLQRELKEALARANSTGGASKH